MATRFETFATLPPLSNTQIQAQAAYMLKQAFVPTIEYAENPSVTDFYWQPWPLTNPKVNAAGEAEPFSPEAITAQVEACSHRHPYAYVRLSGYCPKTRNTTASFVAKTPVEGQVI